MGVMQWRQARETASERRRWQRCFDRLVMGRSRARKRWSRAISWVAIGLPFIACVVDFVGPGYKTGDHRLGAAVDHVINDVIRDWLPKQRQLAHPSTDLVLEVRRRCALAGLALSSRNTVARRWTEQQEIDALKRAAPPQALVQPGTFVVEGALDIVQVDHTQADLFVVDELERKVIGRPWLSLALDVATRCVLSFYVSMERPGAATVGLLLTRAVLSKAPWLAKIGVDAQWPMQGIPRVLHLDNAAEFKSKALRSGCRDTALT
jgi:putative transposase